MDRSSLSRLLLIAGAVLLFYFVLWPKFKGGSAPELQPLGKESLLAPAERKPEELCTIEGSRFRAELSTEDAALKHLFLDGAKYTVDGTSKSPPMDVVTTSATESRLPLRVEWRGPGADSQVKYDLFDWKLAAHDGKSCTFTYEDDKVALTKIVRATGKPFEIETAFTIENKSPEKALHRASIEETAWRTNKSTEGGFGRQSPWTTQLECEVNGKLIDKGAGDFSPKEMARPEFRDGWFTAEGDVDFVATSNFYFTQALVPLEGPSKPACQLQMEERWDASRHGSFKDDPNGGGLYRSRLIWPSKELAPGEKTTYRVLQFAGPKERTILGAAGNGTHHLGDLIKLGTFGFIGKVMVSFLIFANGLVHSWGAAIVILTLTVRTILFPLTWWSLKAGSQMRKLKPELDAIQKKYANDAQQKQLATMELYQKHGMNPLSSLQGCLPALAQMPVWFALYTSLQTAAELYHTPFLWFRDLSAPDTIVVAGHEVPFLLPLLLGGTTFIQQKLMPQQMDPAQQRMMSILMPLLFTGMMLFLPAGLGVYMFTNSVLGIVQQIAVEKYYASQGLGSGVAVREKKDDEKDDGPKAGGSKRTKGSGDAELGAPSAPLGKKGDASVG